jgi:hypothetical protein
MQSRTEDLHVEIEAYTSLKKQLKSFQLYEEYSQKDIVDTIQKRKEAYEKADLQAREELETEVEIEVENFQIWLESVKFAPFAAHYLSVSLQSLLLGLPIGVRIAQLFDAVLDKLGARNSMLP